MSMDVNKIGFVILVGLPGSGKTTLAKSLSQHFTPDNCDEELQYAIHIITYDDLIPIQIQQGGDEVSWKVARREVMEKVETLILRLKKEHALLHTSKQYPRNTFIIIDDNMYYRSMRYEYFQLARAHGISFCQLYLSCTPDEALVCNATRTDSVPNEIVKRMSTRLQPPDTVHNIWERSSLTIPFKDNDFPKICKFITSSLAHSLSPNTQLSVTVVTPSKIHDADLVLRRLVGELIKDQSGNKEQLRSHAAFLNSLRHSMLDKLRAGDLSLPEENMHEFLSQQMHCRDDC